MSKEKLRKAFTFAVNNIARHGDTDIFPYPVENHIFFDCHDKIVKLLQNLHDNFDVFLQHYPPFYSKNLSVVGYSGFRSATQIDPLWNAYFLGLVVAIGEEIECARIPLDRQIVFSYRHRSDPDSYLLFDSNIGWRQYQEVSVENAKKYPFILTTDIADYYPRIYHHRLENALMRASSNATIVKRIMALLSIFSGGTSYGLPIGGPAARLLSEILLNRTDRLLILEEVPFCRFVDDYHIFATSREEAHRFLILLSEKLMTNEGLTLQRHKTRIMSSEEFIATSPVSLEESSLSGHDLQARRFFWVRLKFDPYSPTAFEDYEELKGELEKFDIVGILGREVIKTRIDEGVTRKLIGTIKYLNEPIRGQAIMSLVENLEILYPVFSTVMILIKSVIEELSMETRRLIFSELRKIVKERSYIVQVPTHLAFALRVLAHDPSEETEIVIDKLFQEELPINIKKDIILIMAKRSADSWVSDKKASFSSFVLWEKRSLVIASYWLGDEGSHWREKIRDELSEFDIIVRDWAAQKKQQKSWSLPL